MARLSDEDRIKLAFAFDRLLKKAEERVENGANVDQLCLQAEEVVSWGDNDWYHVTGITSSLPAPIKKLHHQSVA